MIYKEKLEEDKLKQIMEQNISYLDQIAEQMKLGYLSVFAGAGLSVASGYVDWKSLLEPLCKQMRLNINKDLTEIAQYLLWSSFFVTPQPNFCHRSHTTP